MCSETVNLEIIKGWTKTYFCTLTQVAHKVNKRSVVLFRIKKSTIVAVLLKQVVMRRIGKFTRICLEKKHSHR